MMSLGEAHDGADGNPLNVLLMRFTLPALELKMVRLDSVLEHSDVGPCGAPECFPFALPFLAIDSPLHVSCTFSPPLSPFAIGGSKVPAPLGSPLPECAFPCLHAAKRVSFKANFGAQESRVFGGISVSPTTPVFQLEYCKAMVGSRVSSPVHPVSHQVPCEKFSPSSGSPVSLVIPNLNSKPTGVESAEGVSASSNIYIPPVLLSYDSVHPGKLLRGRISHSFPLATESPSVCLGEFFDGSAEVLQLSAAEARKTVHPDPASALDNRKRLQASSRSADDTIWRQPAKKLLLHNSPAAIP
ncbi:hypothetical protein Nepgr_033658 [Nepenthes gracilis]|uniref:Uncharacterized protein n=1 Tax=Nepenthes gracilis TaxID=150966 RepID=A0AAD3Y8T5_NEPGR|nr:hypothetical protein Nepgr_033658 [Nepenthes gracilis]